MAKLCVIIGLAALASSAYGGPIGCNSCGCTVFPPPAFLPCASPCSPNNPCAAFVKVPSPPLNIPCNNVGLCGPLSPCGLLNCGKLGCSRARGLFGSCAPSCGLFGSCASGCGSCGGSCLAPPCAPLLPPPCAPSCANCGSCGSCNCGSCGSCLAPPCAPLGSLAPSCAPSCGSCNCGSCGSCLAPTCASPCASCLPLQAPCAPSCGRLCGPNGAISSVTYPFSTCGC